MKTEALNNTEHYYEFQSAVIVDPFSALPEKNPSNLLTKLGELLGQSDTSSFTEDELCFLVEAVDCYYRKINNL